MKFKLKDLLHLVFLMIFSSVIIYSLKLQGLFIVLILLFYILQKNMCIRTLKNDFKKEREICIKSLNHDLKVATLAQKRALDILAKNNQDDIEIIEEMQNSCNYSLEMIDTLINAYRVCSNKKYLCFQEFGFLRFDILFLLR